MHQKWWHISKYACKPLVFGLSWCCPGLFGPGVVCVLFLQQVCSAVEELYSLGAHPLCGFCYPIATCFISLSLSLCCRWLLLPIQLSSYLGSQVNYIPSLTISISHFKGFAIFFPSDIYPQGHSLYNKYLVCTSVCPAWIACITCAKSRWTYFGIMIELTVTQCPFHLFSLCPTLPPTDYEFLIFLYLDPKKGS